MYGGVAVNKQSVFLGICILLGTITISAAMVFSSLQRDERYQVISGTPPLVFDKTTGTYYYQFQDYFYEVNPVTKTHRQVIK
jgi:hypothetical protein